MSSSSISSSTIARQQSNQPTTTPKCLYARISSSDLPSLQVLGYTLGKTLGSGTYAKVKAAWSMRDREIVAVKILNKSAASRDYLTKFLPREIENLQIINHHHLVQVYQIIETEKQVFFIMELSANGDLLDYINARHALPEAEGKYIFRQMVSGIQHLHKNNLAHRDLKCENVMLSKNMEVKIGDFGFSINLTLAPSKTPCGSYSYAAPELFSSNGDMYDAKKSDAWSLGVILFAMVCGRLPFGDDSQVKKQQKHGLAFPSSRSLTKDIKDLIEGILTHNVRERLDTYDMILHEWTATLPVRVPSPLSSKPKYSAENSLILVHHQTAETIPIVSCNPHMTHHQLPFTSNHQSNPFIARIGAYRRRIADAVRLTNPAVSLPPWGDTSQSSRNV